MTEAERALVALRDAARSIARDCGDDRKTHAFMGDIAAVCRAALDNLVLAAARPAEAEAPKDIWLVAEMRNALGDAEEMLSAIVSMLCADATGDTEKGLARLNSNELARRVDVCRDVLARLPVAAEAEAPKEGCATLNSEPCGAMSPHGNPCTLLSGHMVHFSHKSWEGWAEAPKPLAWLYTAGQCRSLVFEHMEDYRRDPNWTETPLYAHPTPAEPSREQQVAQEPVAWLFDSCLEKQRGVVLGSTPPDERPSWKPLYASPVSAPVKDEQTQGVEAWVARDGDGALYLYVYEPRIDNAVWRASRYMDYCELAKDAPLLVGKRGPEAIQRVRIIPVED